MKLFADGISPVPMVQDPTVTANDMTHDLNPITDEYFQGNI